MRYNVLMITKYYRISSFYHGKCVFDGSGDPMRVSQKHTQSIKFRSPIVPIHLTGRLLSASLWEQRSHIKNRVRKQIPRAPTHTHPGARSLRERDKNLGAQESKDSYFDQRAISGD
jgi:uncharacterized protein (DUF2461 family)